MKTPLPRMRTMCRVALMLLGVFVLPLAKAGAQEAGVETTYTKQPLFKIPFQTDANERRLKQVQLYVSSDQGRSWHPYANARPEDAAFTFTAPRDGLFWFTVRTIDMDNRAFPLTMDNVRPGLKVLVDTQAPTIQLRGQPPRDGLAVVEWEVHDENLELATLALEYRAQGTAEWLPLRVEPSAGGQHAWRPGTSGTLEVRLRARDRAGNDAEQRAAVQAPQESFSGGPTANLAATSPQGGAVRMVNSKHISLNYEVKEVGPSGVSLVELWSTQDGRTWQKHSEDPTHKPPYVVDVNDQGLYGFTLVVRSGVGLSDKPPQAGDPPQVWVEVDLTKPVVKVTSVDVGKGPDLGKLTIAWTASDKNLSRQPITLSYAEGADGPWMTIVANVDNTGKHVWRMPGGIPYKFFVRVEASDRAGNVGSAQSAKEVIVDLAQPKGVILGVEPGK